MKVNQKTNVFKNGNSYAIRVSKAYIKNGQIQLNKLYDVILEESSGA